MREEFWPGQQGQIFQRCWVRRRGPSALDLGCIGMNHIRETRRPRHCTVCGAQPLYPFHPLAKNAKTHSCGVGVEVGVDNGVIKQWIGSDKAVLCYASHVLHTAVREECFHSGLKESPAISQFLISPHWRRIPIKLQRKRHWPRGGTLPTCLWQKRESLCLLKAKHLL